MAINATAEQRRAEASQEYDTKLRLEEKLKPAIKRLLRQMADDLEANVVVTGQAQNADEYIAQWTAIVDQGYQNAKTAFAPTLLDQLEEEPEDSDIWQALLAIGAFGGLTNREQVLAHLRANSVVKTNQFIRTSVPNDVSEISGTNNKDLQAAVSVAAVSLAEELGRQPTRLELAERARKQFLQHDLGRTTTIAATTTQRGAEGSKQVVRQVLDDFRNGTGPLGLGLKPAEIAEYWDAIIDNVTRLHHLEADGQKKENGVFVVKGELLRYPGDTSLGASADNVINCRCSAVTAYKEPT